AADGLRSRLESAVDDIRVGDASRARTVRMGPLIDSAALRRVLEGIERGVAEGADLIRDGRRDVPDTGHFVGPTLFDRVRTESVLVREEWFGPILTLQRPETLDQAI